MDHIVYVDAKAGELEKLLVGTKKMVLRGATGRKLPYGRVQPGDRLFFIRNNGEGQVRAQARVSTVFNSEKLSEAESRQIVADNQEALQLSPAEAKRWGGKRYLVLVGLEEVAPLEPFEIDRRAYGNMDDWLPVGEIETVRK
jgi:hypothetical protein